MRLIADDTWPDFDLVDANDRAERWENVRTGMKMGLITPDNFTWEDRNAVRSFFEQLPIIEPVDPRRGLAKIIGITNLREGWDWCFATSRDGTFGVFSLDEPSRTFLHDATLHLWVNDTVIDPNTEDRLDFTDIQHYQNAALDVALAA